MKGQGRSQRERGKRIERQAAEACRRHLYSPESCVRTSQSKGSDRPDIQDALPGFSVEVKGRMRIAALRFMDQAREDSKSYAEKVGKAPAFPMVLMREDKDTEFYLIIPLSCAANFVAAFKMNQDRLT